MGAEEKGKSSFGYAYYLDTCKEERERGVTIQCNTKEFFTDKYHYTIVDAPGHKDKPVSMLVFFTCLVSNKSLSVSTRWTPATGLRIVSTKSRTNSLRCFN